MFSGLLDRLTDVTVWVEKIPKDKGRVHYKLSFDVEDE